MTRMRGSRGDTPLLERPLRRRIYVLENGVVTEQGTHAELMELAGHYADLFMLQARASVDA